MLVAAVGAWQLYASLWTARSDSAGRALVHRFLENPALQSPVKTPLKSPAGSGSSPSESPSTASLSACQGSASAGTSGKGSTPVHGLLEIPKLGVVAPVVQGVGETQLDVAVGHDPYSVWPGGAGNAVLEAHDVSYFVSLASLAVGDTVRYVTPCTTYVFAVTSHTIVAQGTAVYNTSAPSITMVTCWPTDALWFTPDRYLVTATEVSEAPSDGGSTTYVTASAPPSVPVPATLAAQGVTLTTYSLPMGTFTLAGTPDPAWAQTTSPLLVQGSGVEAFIAGVRSLTEDHLSWWNAIAPGVTAPEPLVGAGNPGYLTQLNVTVTAAGAQPVSVQLDDTLTVTGGRAPGRYLVTVEETIHDGTLLISGWNMQPS